jgi:upstream activation factor subunit UAF30
MKLAFVASSLKLCREFVLAGADYTRLQRLFDSYIEMSVPSDSEIKKAAAEILKGCDVATTTLKSIRTQLEERFQCSLAEKKSIIYESFDKFIAQNEDLIKYNDIVKSENDTAAPEENGEVEATSKKKTKARGGFAADVHVSPELAEFLGTEVLPRTEVTKRIWAYIREHNLQDPRDKRKIMCDAALEKVLKRKSVHMFTMTKVLSAVSSVQSCRY